MSLRGLIVCLFLAGWGVVEWCRSEAEEIREEVQRLCRGSLFRRCTALPSPSEPAWVGLPGAYSVWELLRRRQQLEWARRNLLYMSAADWFLRGVVGFLFALLFKRVEQVTRTVFAEVRNLLRERTLERITRLRQPGSSLLFTPKTPSEIQCTKSSMPQTRPPHHAAPLSSGVPDFIA